MYSLSVIENIEDKNFNKIKENNIDEKKKYILIDIQEITNILANKINNLQKIDNNLIEELTNGLRLFCNNHNDIITDWFDDNYKKDLESFKSLINKYSIFSKKFNNNSFVSIEHFD